MDQTAVDAPLVARTSGGGAATARTLTLRFARAPRAALDTRPALRLDTTAPEGKASEAAHGQAANRHGHSSTPAPRTSRQRLRRTASPHYHLHYLPTTTEQRTAATVPRHAGMSWPAAQSAARPLDGCSLLVEDDHVAVVLKPAGVGLQHPAQKGQRSGTLSVDAWAASALKKSRLRDALVKPCASSPLTLDGIRGPVAVAKTLGAQQALLGGRRDTLCTYTAVLTSLDWADPDSVVSVLQSVEASTFAELHMVIVRTTAERDAWQLAQRLPVLGATGKVPGGIHMSLTSLQLPPGLEELRGGVAQSAFADAVPRKFEKTMTREALHALRRRQAASDPDAESVVAFCGLQFTVPTQALRPRPSSECLVDAAVRAAQRNAQPRILDLGCGCGALMLAALHAMPEGATAVGIDIDTAVLEAARANAVAILGQQRTQQAVQLLHGDFSQLHTPGLRSQLPPEGVDIVLCNPPYLRDAAAVGRTTDESPSALFAGADGLMAYREMVASLVQTVPPLLRPDGVLILQLPASSFALRAVEAICAKHGLRPVGEPVRDGRGVERALVLCWGA